MLKNDCQVLYVEEYLLCHVCYGMYFILCYARECQYNIYQCFVYIYIKMIVFMLDFAK